MPQEPFPSHIDPLLESLWATAPYNFVPLPRKVLAAKDADPTGVATAAHDRYLPGRHNGWIELEIETLTPLFIRGPQRRDRDGHWEEDEARRRPEPWTTPDGRPAIPGSSLRGMTRNLVEILAFAKVQPVSDERLFFRTFGIALAGEYTARMNATGEPEGGFLKQRDDGSWEIRPTEVLEVPHSKLERHADALPNESDPTPGWSLQHRTCWLKLDKNNRVKEVREVEQKDWTPAVMVLTGRTPPREDTGNPEKPPKEPHEYAFLLDKPGKPVPVPDEVWDQFHDHGQISWWQERAFPKGQPEQSSRDADGHLRNDEPVFFVRSADQKRVRFLGRARMFRLPYDRSLRDMVPEHLRDGADPDGPVDLAEAIFGRVTEESGPAAIKGRVRFGDAVIDGDTSPDDWYEPEFIPYILGSPKPTTFAHYLTQDGETQKLDKKGEKPDGDAVKLLTTYIGGHDPDMPKDRTVARGHKLYWHRADRDSWRQMARDEDMSQPEQIEALKHGNPDDPKYRQRTVIKPVRAGLRFTGRIHVENLSDVELGALLAAFELPEGCEHRLGMGRPLGLGSVRITAKLHLIDRAARYRSWADSGVSSAAEEVARQSRAAFTAAVWKHAEASGEPRLSGKQELDQITRLNALFKLLRWQGPAGTDTAYMELDDFKKYLVLPTPHAVAKEPVPPPPDVVAPKALPRKDPKESDPPRQ